MRKCAISIIGLLIISNSILAQGQDKLWFMGYGCCSPNFTGINMDFRSGSLIVSSVIRHFNFADTNGQICDKNGNILFYSNGISIANRLDNIMLNGDSLNPADYTFAHSTYGLHLPQANLVIPFPGDSMKYYLFHETSDDRYNTYATFFLYFSIIDMQLDGGMGGVVQKNTVLLHDSLVEGELTACKHANGRDWWLISHKWQSDTSYKFLITPSGIQGPWIDELTWRTNYFGQAVFSQDGSKYAYYEPYQDLDIWDFDRCSGLFSNLIHIDILDSMGAGGVAFSRSGRFLYVSSINFLYQFDMMAIDIPASRITIATYDGYATNGLFQTVFYLQQLAPDDKIYITSTSSVMEYHVINFPDSAGMACDFQQHSISMPGYTKMIPNHPNYFLGVKAGSHCDSLSNDVQSISSVIPSFTVFPNPSKNKLYITQSPKHNIDNISILSTVGQEEYIDFSVLSSQYLEVNISKLSPGIYFLRIFSDNRTVVKRFIKE